MPKFTEDQQLAIDQEGENILVSAGAGSGKTAVLTERVLRKIRQGVHIQQLLILTFTKKAAMEMKDRIRKKLVKEQYQEELDAIDSSYITTFDAFSLAVVKKYGDCMHLSKNIKIMEETVLKLKKQEILDQIFDKYYEHPTPSFEQLIYYFCLKEDQGLKDKILALDEALDLNLEKEKYIKSYIEEYYQNDIIEKNVQEYLTYVEEKKQELFHKYQTFIGYIDGKYLEKMELLFSPVFQTKTYEELKERLSFTIPRLPSGQEEEVKVAKEEVKKALESLQELTTYESVEAMRIGIWKTKDRIAMILKILEELNDSVQLYKREKESYTFMDIEKMAIALVRDYDSVRKELMESFQEILVDEYQDTNDIQETFLSYISNHNVYMVGDIKQSIYRFRNANPNIFKEKYRCYKGHQNGCVIDLAKNFRSRREVLMDINQLFCHIMDENIGGVSYQEGHAMIFGNKTYEEAAKTDEDYHLDILAYTEDGKDFSSVEKEAFLIGYDIKQKINQKIKVYDKDQDCLRTIEYRDIVILLDRSTDFVKYKQIFEYLGIPLTLWQSDLASGKIDLELIKNIFLIGFKLSKNSLDSEFTMAYTSLARSFLYEISDQEIYQTIQSKDFLSSKICQDLKEILIEYDFLSPAQYLRKVLEKMQYEEKLYKIGNVDLMSARLEYFYSLVSNLESLGFTLEGVTNYFSKIIDSSIDIKLALSRPESNSVKIMTIHTSKGLEYPICYFAGFTKKFNESDFKQSVLYDSCYGIVIPDFENQENLITKQLILRKLKVEDISEKIRLFYVALTRAREKIIIVMPKIIEKERVEDIVNDEVRLNYHSFAAIMESIYSYFYDRVKEYKEIPDISKDYLKRKEIQKEDVDIKTLDLITSQYHIKEIEQEKLSKEKKEKRTKEEQELMEFGRYLHTLLERLDFKNNQMVKISDLHIQKKVQFFLIHPFIQTKRDYDIYQEYEFLSYDGSKKVHGKIDLLLVGDKEAVIIDYKLKNTIDIAYQKQMKGYKKFIEGKTKKKTTCYLYSILKEEFTKIEV